MTSLATLPPLRAHHPSEGEPELLFIMAHDHPGQLQDLQMLIGAIARLFPKAAIVAMDLQGENDAPHPWLNALSAPIPGKESTQTKQTLTQVQGLVHALSTRYGLSADRVALVGHGRGATLWLETSLAHPGLAGRVLAFCGGFVGRPHHHMAGTTVHLVHGMADASSSPADVVDAAQALVDLGADITADLLPDEAHPLTAVLVEKMLQRVQTYIPQRLWQAAMQAAPHTD